MYNGHFTIKPKDKKLLKSSKVRDWFKKVEEYMGPAVPEIERAAIDAMMYGTGAVKLENGKVMRIEPREVYGQSPALEAMKYLRTPLDPKKEAFSALAALKRRCQGTPHQDQRAWDVLAQAVADYCAPVKHTGMWIEVHKTKAGLYWQYALKRKNGKGQMISGWFKRRIDCMNTAQRTARALGLSVREGRA